MDKLIIPQGCVIDGEATSIRFEGDIFIENAFLPKVLQSDSGNVQLVATEAETNCEKVVAERGSVSVKAKSFTCDRISAMEVSLEAESARIANNVIAQGELAVTIRKGHLESCFGDSITIKAGKLTATTIEGSTLVHIEAENAVINKIQARKVVISGNLECKQIIAPDGVQVLAGKVSIKSVTSPKFHAAPQVTGIVMVATCEDVKAEGIRGFLHPSELGFLTGAGDAISVPTADLTSMATSAPQGSAPEPPQAEPVLTQPAEEEAEDHADFSGTEAIGLPEEEEAGELVPEELEEEVVPGSFNVDDAAEELEPEPEVIEAEDLVEELDPEAFDAGEFDQEAFDSEDLDAEDLEAVDLSSEDELEAIEDPEPLYVAAQADPIEPLPMFEPEPDIITEELPESVSFDGPSDSFFDDELLEDQELEVPDDILDDIATDDFDTDPAAAFNVDSLQAPTEEKDEEMPTEEFSVNDLASPAIVSEDLDEIGPDDLEEEDDMLMADEEGFTQLGEDQELEELPAVDDFGDMGDVLDPDSELLGEGDPLDPEELEDDFGDLDPFGGNDDLDDEDQPEEDFPDELSGVVESEELDPEDALVRDLNHTLEQVRGFFPGDNIPSSISQIQRYIDERRFNLFAKARNREAVLNNFDKFDHPEISRLVREFFARLETWLEA